MNHDDELIVKLRALIADWRSRQFDFPTDPTSAEVHAQNVGKEDAYRDAADELERLLSVTQ